MRSNPSSKKAKPASLLGLPSELRLMIYEYLMTDVNSIYPVVNAISELNSGHWFPTKEYYKRKLALYQRDNWEFVEKPLFEFHSPPLLGVGKLIHTEFQREMLRTPLTIRPVLPLVCERYNLGLAHFISAETLMSTRRIQVEWETSMRMLNFVADLLYHGWPRIFGPDSASRPHFLGLLELKALEEISFEGMRGVPRMVLDLTDRETRDALELEYDWKNPSLRKFHKLVKRYNKPGR